MVKYSKELIFKYIHGDEIDEDLLEQLENDLDFMIEVIRVSQDKNFYNLCSFQLQNNYEFIKRFILLRKNDLEFINKLAKKYLKSLDESLERTELILIMQKLNKNRDEEKYLEYSLLAQAIYVKQRTEIEIDKAMVKTSEFFIKMGMGFWLILDLYHTSSIILDFYAKKIIEEILSQYGNVEDSLHKRFRKPEDIDSFGINNFMLGFIEKYDSMLATYLRSHLDLLADFSFVIKRAQKNWDKYIDNKEEEKYCLMIQKVHEYMEEHECEAIFTETDILYFVGQKMGIGDTIFKYDCIDEECYEMIKRGLDSLFYKQILENSFKDKIHYYNVKKIMSDILYGKYDETLVHTFSSNDKPLVNGQILKVDFKKQD